jgi:hypothetical protein
MKQLQHTSETSKTLETYIYNIGEKSHQGGSRRRATAREHHQHRAHFGCPWLSRGRPKVPRHMHPSGHGGVHDARDGDVGQTDNEWASGTCDWDGRGAVGDGTWGRGEGMAHQPTSARWERGVWQGGVEEVDVRPRAHVETDGWAYERSGYILFLRESGWVDEDEPHPDGTDAVAKHYQYRELLWSFTLEFRLSDLLKLSHSWLIPCRRPSVSHSMAHKKSNFSTPNRKCPSCGSGLDTAQLGIICEILPPSLNICHRWCACHKFDLICRKCVQHLYLQINLLKTRFKNLSNDTNYVP